MKSAPPLRQALQEAQAVEDDGLVRLATHDLGVALNRVDARGGRRSFYDGLYYSKAFSGYYAKE